MHCSAREVAENILSYQGYYLAIVLVIAVSSHVVRTIFIFYNETKEACNAPFIFFFFPLDVLTFACGSVDHHGFIARGSGS